tara:strand:+ start:20504 stop:20866 length:363 start_codon:yes stop_codon:yes gene_type:complete
VAKVLDYFPDVSDKELIYLRNSVEDLDEKMAREFAAEYHRRRRSPGLIMVLTLIGFLGLAGLQRFALGKVGTGFLYLFTLGFAGVGTIIDLIRYEQMAYDYNRCAAQRVDIIIRGDAEEL